MLLAEAETPKSHGQDGAGIDPRYVTYKFELDNKLYDLSVCMSNTWQNAGNPTVTLSAEGVDPVSEKYSVTENVVKEMKIDLTNAKVNANGKVELTVRATSNDPTIQMNYIIIRDKNSVVNVSSVELDKTNLTLNVGDEEQLTATVTPENATNKNLIWETSDPSVATVENGKVTALKEGNVTVTVKTQDGEKTAVCQVEVKEDTTSPSDKPITITVTPKNSFVEGKASDDIRLTVGKGTDITATENFKAIKANGKVVNVGSVGKPGSQGSVADGSIEITLNKNYLNTLSAGKYTLEVELKDNSYDGKKVSTLLTVLPKQEEGTEPGTGDDGNKPGTGGNATTGDNTNVLPWLALLAASALSCAYVLFERKRKHTTK